LISKKSSPKPLCQMDRNLVGSIYGRFSPIRNKKCLWRPCLLTDQNRMSNSHRGPSIDASSHVSVHLAKRFQRRRFFRNQPTNIATTCNYEWYRLYRSYENFRRPGVAILDMQMSKVPIIFNNEWHLVTYFLKVI
jgi:hypothetical protein